jgi:hypothetical protein
MNAAKIFSKGLFLSIFSALFITINLICIKIATSDDAIPPEVTGSGIEEICVGEPLDPDLITASDPLRGALTFSIAAENGEQLPDGLTINSNTGKVAWVPLTADGLHHLVITAANGSSTVAQHHFQVNVAAQLAQNSGFETGPVQGHPDDIPNWIRGSLKNTRYIERVIKDNNSDEHCLKFSKKSSDSNYMSIYQICPISLTPGKEYELSCWFKAPLDGVGYIALVRTVTMNNSMTSNTYSRTVRGNGNWRKAAINVKIPQAPDGAAVTWYIYLCGKENMLETYYDDVVLKEANNRLPPYGFSTEGNARILDLGADDEHRNVMDYYWDSAMTDKVISGDRNFRYLRKNSTVRFNTRGWNVDNNGKPLGPMLFEICYLDDKFNYSWDRASASSSSNIDFHSPLNGTPVDKMVQTRSSVSNTAVTSLNRGQWTVQQYLIMPSEFTIMYSCKDSRGRPGRFEWSFTSPWDKMDPPINPGELPLPGMAIDYVSLREIPMSMAISYLKKQKLYGNFWEEKPPLSNVSYSSVQVFVRPIEQPILLSSVPESSEVNPDPSRNDSAKELTAYTALGDFAHMKLGVYCPPQGILSPVSIDFTALTGPNGVTIGTDKIHPYLVKHLNKRLLPPSQLTSPDSYSYALLPAYLGTLNNNQFEIKPGTSETVWFKVDVPDSIAGGHYDGIVTVTADGIQQTVPMKLTILGKKLDTAYSNIAYYDPWVTTYSDGSIDNVMDLYRLTHMIPYFRVREIPIRDSSGIPIVHPDPVTGVTTFDLSKFKQQLTALKSAGVLHDGETIVCEVNAYQGWQAIYESVYSPLKYNTRDPDCLLNLWDRLSGAAFANMYKDMIRQINQASLDLNIKIEHAVLDEPGNNPLSRIITDRLLTHIMSLNQPPDNLGLITTGTYNKDCYFAVSTAAPADGSRTYMVPNDLIPALTTALINKPLYRMKDEDWAYDNYWGPMFGYYTTYYGHLADPTYNRFLHGAFAWKTGVSRIAAFCISSIYVNPYDDLDDSNPDLEYAYMTRNHGGLFMPGLAATGIGEGYEDAKGIATLQNFINSAPASSQLADSARTYLNSLNGYIDAHLQSYLNNRVSDWGFTDRILNAVSGNNQNSVDYRALEKMRKKVFDYIDLFSKAPTNLNSYPLSARQIRLAWADNNCDESGFVIQISSDGSTFVDKCIAPANSTSTIVTDDPTLRIEPATTYYFRVCALNGDNRSVYSNTVSATTLSLSNAPSNLTAKALSSTQIRLTWKDNSDNETGFMTQISRDGGATFVDKYKVPANTPSCIIADYSTSPILPDTKYEFRVCAIEGAKRSEYSNVVSATTLPLPEAPTNLMAAASSSTRVALEWLNNAPDATSSEIWYGTDGVNFVHKGNVGPGTGVTSYTAASSSANPVRENTTYFFKVRAKRMPGPDYSPFSEIVKAATPPLPNAPSNLTAKAVSPTQIDLEWQDNSPDETRFYVYYSTDGVNFTYKGSVAADITKYTAKTHPLNPVNPATKYYFKVCAIRMPGPDKSEYSNIAEAKTP